MKQKFLAAKLVLVVALSSALSVTHAQAGIPVIDGTNLAQNVMTAVESVAQTLKQIEQYRTQLQQYENMLQNTAAPTAYIWDQAQSTINGLMNATNTLGLPAELGVEVQLHAAHDVVRGVGADADPPN